MSDRDDRSLRDDLHALLDGELDSAREAEVRRRLGADPGLQREFDSLKRTVGAVRRLPGIPAPADLGDRIRARTTDAAARPGGGLAPILRRFFPMAALAAAILVAVVVTNRPDNPEPERLPDEAVVPKRQAPEVVLDEEFRAAKERAARPRPADGGGALEKKAAGRRGRLVPSLDKDQAAPPGALAEAPGKRRASSPKGFAAPADSTGLLRAAAKGDPIGKRFGAYLGALGGLERARLRGQIESFGVLGPSGAPRGGKSSRGSSSGIEARLASRAEAQEVAALLRRAYPVAERKKEIAESDAAAGGSSTAMFSDSKRGTMVLRIEATPGQFRKIESWLQRISPARRGEHAGKTPRGYSSGLAGSSRRQSYRISLAFPKKKK